jgi:hypothetical protein
MNTLEDIYSITTENDQQPQQRLHPEDQHLAVEGMLHDELGSIRDGRASAAGSAAAAAAAAAPHRLGQVAISCLGIEGLLFLHPDDLQAVTDSSNPYLPTRGLAKPNWQVKEAASLRTDEF